MALSKKEKKRREELGWNIRKAREAHGYQLKELAVKLKVTVSMLSQIEAGKKNTAEYISSVAKILEIKQTVLEMENSPKYFKSNIEYIKYLKSIIKNAGILDDSIGVETRPLLQTNHSFYGDFYFRAKMKELFMHTFTILADCEKNYEEIQKKLTDNTNEYKLSALETKFLEFMQKNLGEIALLVFEYNKLHKLLAMHSPRSPRFWIYMFTPFLTAKKFEKMNKQIDKYAIQLEAFSSKIPKI